jgi:rubrerythrin
MMKHTEQAGVLQTMFMNGRAPQDVELVQDIKKAIDGEYSAIICYEQLAKIAPTEKERNQILEIRNDEISHYRTFAGIYMQLTGRQPQPQITEECATVYKKGLEASIEDEQKTVDFYLDIAEKAQNPYIKEQFKRAAADEQNHAVWFLYFYTKLR